MDDVSTLSRKKLTRKLSEKAQRESREHIRVAQGIKKTSQTEQQQRAKKRNKKLAAVLSLSLF